MTATPLN